MQTLLSRIMNVFALTLGMLGSGGVAIWAQDSMQVQHVKSEPSTALTLTVGGTSQQFSRADLAKMNQTSVTVHNSHTNRDEVYKGVMVSDLLSTLGLPFSKETQQLLLHSYVRAQGTDFYFVLYSASEVEPEMTHSRMLVAISMNGQDLREDGAFKLVSTGDTRPARWVHNLLSITLVTVN